MVGFNWRHTRRRLCWLRYSVRRIDTRRGSLLLIAAVVMMLVLRYWTIMKLTMSVEKPHMNPKISESTIPKEAAAAAETKRRTEMSRASSLPMVRDVYKPVFQIPNPTMCHARPEEDSSSQLKLMIIVPSVARNKVQRTAVRQTWGNVSFIHSIRLAYLIGKTLDQEEQRILWEESEQFGDIIQTANMDGYDNLSLKTTAILQWIKEYCPNVSFVLKADGDAFINLPGLFKFMDDHQHDANTVYGRCSHGYRRVIRNKNSKFYTSRSEYPDEFFPPYCTGPAYLMTRDAVSRLYEGALDSILLKIEDILVTGIVAENSGVTRMHVPEFWNFFVPRTSLPPLDGCDDFFKTISYHPVSPDRLYKLWDILYTRYKKCYLHLADSG